MLDQGLLAAHRGGYMDAQRDEGPAPLLWRFSDFLKWAELCPSEPEIGHALMRLVMTGQEIPHACEVLNSVSIQQNFFYIPLHFTENKASPHDLMGSTIIDMYEECVVCNGF